MMRENDFSTKFEQELNVYKKEGSYVNPLAIFETYYFKTSNTNNYRGEALKRCIDERVSFSATENNKSNLIGHYVTITCPECDKEMTYVSNNKHECTCGNKAELYVEEIAFSFSKAPFYEAYVGQLIETTSGRKIIHILGKNNKSDENFSTIALVSGQYNEKISMCMTDIEYRVNRGKTNDEIKKLIESAQIEIRAALEKEKLKNAF